MKRTPEMTEAQWQEVMENRKKDAEARMRQHDLERAADGLEEELAA